MLTKNWSEDRFKAYEELQIFLARRAAGDLEVQRYQKKINFHHRPVRVKHSDTPFVTFGIPMHFRNGDFQIAADMDDSQRAANVSGTSSSKGAVWRCCFHLQPAISSQQPDPLLSNQRDESTLHYGGRVFVQTFDEPSMVLCLRSLNNPSQQVLRFEPQSGVESCWQVMAVNPVNRDLLFGLPVANDDSTILRHCLTGRLLCLEPKLKNTDFGPERVVSARNVVDVRRRNDLHKVKEGNVLGNLGASVGGENCWKLSLATENEDLPIT